MSRGWRIAAAALLLIGCQRTPEQTFRRAPVVLISVDTLRSDHLPAYGYRGVKTPNIDALRRDSILFQRAYSHCPMTLPSHVSILTGLLPTEHGVRNNIGYRFDGGKFRTLAGVLRSTAIAPALRCRRMCFDRRPVSVRASTHTTTAFLWPQQAR